MVPKMGERRNVMHDGVAIRVAWLDPTQVDGWIAERPQDGWLSAEEIDALEGMSPDGIRDRLAARLALKLLVQEEERFAGVPLQQISVRSGERGRPRLVVAGRDEDMPSISLSHARGWGAAATASIGAVGVDIEHERRGIERVKRRLLAPDEDAGDVSSILRLWVLKEAAVKALGAGLDLPLSQVRVTRMDGWAEVAMPAEIARWDPSARLIGHGRWWTTGSSAIASVHFLTDVQDS